MGGRGAWKQCLSRPPGCNPALSVYQKCQGKAVGISIVKDIDHVLDSFYCCFIFILFQILKSC